MGRRKIDIEYIKDDKARGTTFAKRKTGLFKKAHELGVLTGTQIAVIVFSQQDRLFTYSSDPVAQICARYLANQDAVIEAKLPHDFGMEDDESDGDDAASSQPNSARKGSLSKAAMRRSSNITQATLPAVDGRPADQVRRSPERRPSNHNPSAIATISAPVGFGSPMMPSPQSTPHRSPSSRSRGSTPELERAGRKRPRSPLASHHQGEQRDQHAQNESDGHGPKYVKQEAGSSRHLLSDVRDSPRQENSDTTNLSPMSSTPPLGSSQIVLPSMQHYPNPLPQYHTQRSGSVSSLQSNNSGHSPRLPVPQLKSETDLPAPIKLPAQPSNDVQRPVPMRGGPMGPPLIIPNQHHGSSGGDAREGARLSATHLTQAPPLLLHPAGSGSAGGPLSRALHPGDNLTPIESPGGFASTLFGGGGGNLNGIGSQVTVPRIATDVGTLFYNWDKNEPGLSPATSFALNQMAPPAENSFRAAEQRSANNVTPTNNTSANTAEGPPASVDANGERPPISAGVLENFSPTTRTWLRQHAFPDPGK